MKESEIQCAISPTLSDRFWRSVNRGPDDACWIWTGYRDPCGYGRISIRTGRDALAHRVSWFLENGCWPEMHLLHKCDNPQCVRVDHLFEGTQSDNIKDMDSKGRRKTVAQHGEDCNFAKLNKELVILARKEVAEGRKQVDVAARLGISKSNLNMIIRRYTWKHI